MSPRTSWRASMTVLRKELRDAVRDRRSLMSSLLFPLFGPAMVAFMFFGIIDRATSTDALELPVVGARHAPGLVEHLEHHGVEVLEPPTEGAEASVRRGELAAALVVPADFGERFRAGKSVRVELLVDDSRREHAKAVREIRRRLDAYGSRIAALRLLARGVHPELVRPVPVDDVDLATPQRHAANMLNMVSGFVMLAAFIGGMFIATDSTAGERERKSLEPLLLNPVPRAQLVLGKWGATMVFGAISLLLTLVGSIVALGMVPFHELGLSLSFGPRDVVLGIAALVPVVPMAAALELVVATLARSFREAQTYMSLLVFVPMLPGVFLSIEPVESSTWMFTTPVLGSQMLVFDILRGEPVSALAYALLGLAVTVVSAGALLVTTRLFARERIMFG